MSVLDILSKKARRRQVVSHPVKSESPEVRAAYIEAVTWAFTLTSIYGDRMMERLDELSAYLRETVPDKVKIGNFIVREEDVDSVISRLGGSGNSRKVAALLLFDLYLLAFSSGKAVPAMQELADLLSDALNMPEDGRRLLAYAAARAADGADPRPAILQIACSGADYWDGSGEILNYIINYYSPRTVLREYAAAIYGSRAWHCLKNGLWEKALADFNSALALEPRNRLWLMGRGCSYAEAGQYPQAILDYSQVLQHNATDALAYYYRAGAYERMGALEEALSDIDKAIQLSGKDYKFYQLAGDIQARREHYADAARFYELALASGGVTGEIYNSLAYAYFHQGQVIEAISKVNKAIETEPDNPEWLDSRAEFYLSMEDYDQVLADCASALRLDPEICRPYYLQGIAYEKLGNADEAVRCYQKFIELAEEGHPDLAAVQDKLAGLTQSF
ncbi:tetratricopeptide repeat protein [Sporolituus thermophilus]|uniref:Tetratricopeptide repeat-containing protein n=1 Tax=Sporolituus thermophilus DSM 23256 TaxID=1123285 RepID=A0A1G7JT89_9FIRM|nr:tetratricopeptide repeat protein [Sporolituus thermophilus]SDF28153.1 Tetratricopeptide repeat-containing protein [Sporolituus thermophilus DSM 23256]